MRTSPPLCAAILVSFLALLSCWGCSGTPDQPSTFAMPNIGGVPDQWEPDLTASERDEMDSIAELDEADPTF